jgi:hypothetical protein
VRLYGEHAGENIAKLRNPLGTWREHSANTLGSREIWKKSPPPPPPFPPNIKGKKQGILRVHAWAFPLAAWNFSSQKSWSPFLASANTPCKEHPTYSVLGHIWFENNSLPGFSNISDLENCRFWIYQNLKSNTCFTKEPVVIWLIQIHQSPKLKELGIGF